jgi:putative ABC transport system permease protein
MIKNYFLITCRRLVRNKLTSLIKLISLFIGIVCFSLIAVYVFFELSFDRFNKQADNIVRVTSEFSVNGARTRWAVNGTKSGPYLQQTFPAVKSFTRIISNPKVVKNNNISFNETGFLFVDSSFLKIFTFPIIEGDASNALDGPGKIVISKSMAKKYFGNDDPLGKNLVIDGSQNYTITGISSDPPDNSQIKFDFLVSLTNMEDSKTEAWFPANFLTYVLLEKGTDLTNLNKKVDENVRAISKQDSGYSGIDYFTLNLEPLTRVHLHSSIDGLGPNTPFIYIYILIIIAILILVIAIINYTNITVAQVSEKRTEIGIRKLLGAQKEQLFLQFIGESGILAVLAALLSIIGAVILMPYFNTLTGRIFPVSLLFQPVIVGTVIILCVTVSLMAGAYPALIVSGHTLINILKPGSLLAASGGKFRRTLIIFQFAISIILIITTLVIQQQRSYIQNVNLGYNKTRVISLPIGRYDWPNFYNLKAALKQNPYVKEVCSANRAPVKISWTNTMAAATETGEKKFSVRANPVDVDFVKTLGIEIIAGSDFTESDLQQVKALKNTEGFKSSCILNETAVKAIGWTPQESIGRQINIGYNGIIKAVVKDFHIASLHEQVMPLVIFLMDEYQSVILIKINSSDMPAVLSSIKKIWSEHMTNRPFEYHFLDEEYETMYINEHRTAGIFSTFSTIAILLACLGLFGIVAIMTVQRTKETGVRKIMGATAGNIILQLFRDYLKPVVFAFIIAAPVAWYISNKWLNGFAYHITIPVWVFIVSALFSIAISMATISIQSVRAALSNPADSLRSE